MVEAEKVRIFQIWENEVLSLLKTRESSSVEELAANLNIDALQLQDVLVSLLERNLIRRVKSKKRSPLRYRLSNQAESAFNQFICKKVFSVIEKLRNCTYQQLCHELGMSRSTIRKYLDSLVQEQKIVSYKIRGNLKGFSLKNLESNNFVGSEVSDKKSVVCSFCGSPIRDKGNIFNIFFPEIVYCTKKCKEINAPELTFSDLDNFCSDMGKSNILAKNSYAHSLKEKEQIILVHIQNIKKACSIREVSKYTGLAHFTVQYHLNLLLSKNLVKREKVRNYFQYFCLEEA